MDVFARNNVNTSGTDGPAIVFSHGFGCDQNMWRYVAPEFEANRKVVLFDHVGAGRSELTAYDPTKYASLQGYADDVVELIEALDVGPVVFVGHSVSSMIGALASIKKPELFESLVMVGPSPRYINDGSYVGGFTQQDIEGLLDSLDSNYLGWSSTMAPVIMGNADRPELGDELTNSFCQTDPTIAKAFAKATFLSDSRADIERVQVPTLVLQCSDDAIAPTVVGEYVRDHIANSSFEILDATGHCPNLSAPTETTAAIKTFLDSTNVNLV